MSANQFNTNANKQDVSSVWTVPEQHTTNAHLSVNSSSDSANIDRCQATKHNVPEIYLK